MKKTLLLLMSICFLTTTQAQQFSFQMFFTDAIGNKDTITLGYDLSATDSIDGAFGETNIISTTLDTTLDVRITNEWDNQQEFGTSGTFHTKRQIIPYNCSIVPLIRHSSIGIHTKHWPVTATWDSSLFADSCRNGSLFTSVRPGGWWDTGSPSSLIPYQVFATADSVTFTSNAAWDYEDFCYIIGTDTVPVFWQAFGGLSILRVAINKIQAEDISLKVFPNPMNQHFSIQVAPEFGNIKNVQVFSSLGQLMLTTKEINNIDVTKLTKGLYLIVLTNEKGNTISTRTLKE